MKPIMLVTTTLENMKDAERIAAILLKSNLIACAQISGPITSLYRWKGEVVSATEFTLSLKTIASCTEMVKAVLLREHPYDLPEIIIQQIDSTSDEYSKWVYGEVTQ